MTTDGLIAQPEPWHKGPRRDSSADGITECLHFLDTLVMLADGRPWLPTHT